MPAQDTPSPTALWKFAEEYHRAANSLLPIAESVTAPIYHLYAHTLELAFKAFLASHGVPVPKIHDLEILCTRSRKLGLVLSEQEFVNVIRLLGSENSQQGFRYFNFASAGRPEINYLRGVVDDVMVKIEKVVAKTPAKPKGKGKRVVLKFVLSKPRPKGSID